MTPLLNVRTTCHPAGTTFLKILIKDGGYNLIQGFKYRSVVITKDYQRPICGKALHFRTTKRGAAVWPHFIKQVLTADIESSLLFPMFLIQDTKLEMRKASYSLGRFSHHYD